MSKDLGVLRRWASRPIAMWRELPIELGPGPCHMLVRDLNEDVGSRILKFAAHQVEESRIHTEFKNPKGLVIQGG